MNRPVRVDRLPAERRYVGYEYYEYDGPWMHHVGFWWFDVSWKTLEAFL